jgi:hypothetical protein
MEHRWSIRKQCEYGVAVNSPNSGTAIGRMRNIGLGGMLIETGALVLPMNAAVSVGFALIDDDELENPFRLQGMVVHRTANGFGVMFLETAADTINALRRALYPEPRSHVAQWPRITSTETLGFEPEERVTRKSRSAHAMTRVAPGTHRNV